MSSALKPSYYEAGCSNAAEVTNPCATEGILQGCKNVAEGWPTAVVLTKPPADDPPTLSKSNTKPEETLRLIFIIIIIRAT